MAIVELKVDDSHNKHDAPDHVDFTIEQIEPAMRPDFEDHLRDLTRTVFQKRRLASDDEQLEIETQADLARPLDQVIEDGKGLVDPDLEEKLEADEQDGDEDPPDPDDPAYEPHPFDGREGYACATCDQPADSAVHTSAAVDEAAAAVEEDPVPA